MHLMIPFASTLSEACVHTLRDLQLPTLSRLLARFSPAAREGGDEYALSMPQERAFASALGWHGADGCLRLQRGTARPLLDRAACEWIRESQLVLWMTYEWWLRCPCFLLFLLVRLYHGFDFIR